jgi:hypothetical protein
MLTRPNVEIIVGQGGNESQGHFVLIFLRTSPLTPLRKLRGESITEKFEILNSKY